jgi:hypothetical protein
VPKCDSCANGVEPRSFRKLGGDPPLPVSTEASVRCDDDRGGETGDQHEMHPQAAHPQECGEPDVSTLIVQLDYPLREQIAVSAELSSTCSLN